MSAITLLDTFGGTSDPLTGADGWTITHGTGFSEAGGVAIPKSYAADQGMVWTTGFTEDNTNWTTGTICKVIFDGGFEAGAEWRLIYDYADVNNYRYVKIKWQSITNITLQTIWANWKNDEVELWKVVSGTHSQVTGTSATRRLQQSPGDLRHYELKNRGTTLYPAVTILTFKDQHIVKVTMKDRIAGHDRDAEDEIVLQETDTRTTTNGKVGIYSVAGSQTITVRSVQAQLVNVNWIKTTGNDSTGTGSETAPWATIKKLVAETLVNEVGVIVNGTYTSEILSYNDTVNSGTSREDAILITRLGNDKPIWRGGSISCFQLKGSQTDITFNGIDFDGNRTTRDVVKLWAQNTGGDGLVPKRIWFQNCRLRNAGTATGVGNNIQVGIFILSGTPTTADWEQFHRLVDCEIDNSRSPGFYVETGQNVVEYCWLHDNGFSSNRPGGKFSYGTTTGIGGTKVTNDNIGRFNLAEDNAGPGLETYAGHRNKFDFNICRRNNLAQGGDFGGILVWGGAEETHVRNNLCYDNGQNNIVVSSNFNHDVPGPLYIDSNTMVNGPGAGFRAYKSGSGTVGDLHYTNNLEYNNATEKVIDTGWTLTTNLNNWKTTDGDPSFVNAPSFNFKLNDNSSLIDAGLKQTWTLPMDLELQPRPQELVDTGNGAYDIGCYEVTDPTLLPENALVSSSTVTKDVENTVEFDVGGTGANAIIEVWFRASNGTFTNVTPGTGVTSH